MLVFCEQTCNVKELVKKLMYFSNIILLSVYRILNIFYMIKLDYVLLLPDFDTFIIVIKLHSLIQLSFF